MGRGLCLLPTTITNGEYIMGITSAILIGGAIGLVIGIVFSVIMFKLCKSAHTI